MWASSVCPPNSTMAGLPASCCAFEAPPVSIAQDASALCPQCSSALRFAEQRPVPCHLAVGAVPQVWPESEAGEASATSRRPLAVASSEVAALPLASKPWPSPFSASEQNLPAAGPPARVQTWAARLPRQRQLPLLPPCSTWGRALFAGPTPAAACWRWIPLRASLTNWAEVWAAKVACLVSPAAYYFLLAASSATSLGAPFARLGLSSVQC